MCEPRYFTVRDVKNPFMQGAVIDHRVAREQWKSLRQALEATGVNTFTLNPVPDLEDMVFSANLAFVGNAASGKQFLIPSRMRYPSRQREVTYYSSWLRNRGFEEIDIELGEEFLEGHGDLLWHPNRPIVWAGYGFRSSRLGVNRFAAVMRTLGVEVRSLALQDARFYHLDTCFSPLNEETALLYPGAFSQDALALLRNGWRQLHEVTLDEALRFACNGIVTRNRLIAPYVPERLTWVLDKEKLEITTVDLSQFEKSGGSAFCMKLFIE